MATATAKRKASSEDRADYERLVTTLAGTGGPVNVGQHANTLARAGRSGEQLLADVHTSRGKLREQAAASLAECEAKLSGDVQTAQAAAMKELEELTALERECRDKIDAKRVTWQESRTKSDSLYRRATGERSRARETLTRTCDPTIAEKILHLEQKLSRLQRELDAPSPHDVAPGYDPFRPAPDAPPLISEEQRSANLAEQADVRKQIDALVKSKLEPSAFSV